MASIGVPYYDIETMAFSNMLCLGKAVVCPSLNNRVSNFGLLKINENQILV